MVNKAVKGTVGKQLQMVRMVSCLGAASSFLNDHTFFAQQLLHRFPKIKSAILTIPANSL
jgi:hypothetical protein